MRQISELGRQDRDGVGAKATTLGELHALGVPVPAGFVITDADLRRLVGVESDRLAADIVAECDRLDSSHAATFAVRSCASDEDGAVNSQAGRYRTFLDVEAREVPGVAEDVWQDCVARAGRGASVIVQRMIIAARAGVIFTVHPVTGRADEAVIEVVAGLGDQLVGGRTTPTRYVVASSTGRKNRRLGPQGACLSDSEIDELMRIGKLANSVIGVPCELEWAIADDGLHILQCRPITAIASMSAALAGEGAVDSPWYRRQYESRNARPWYTMTSVGVFGSPLRGLTGFEYRDIISITDAEMRTSGYHEVGELGQAEHHFASFWAEPQRVSQFIARCDRTFRRARRLLDRCWSMEWTLRDTEDLFEELHAGEDVFRDLFSTMVVTQPQHVAPLEHALREHARGAEDPEAVIVAATRCGRPLPTDAEDRELARLRGMVRRGLDDEALSRELDRVAAEFGWIAAVESGAAYDGEHYRARVLLDPPPRPDQPPITVDGEALRVGRLVGDLGNYRLWNRYYFMAVRHVLQRIIDVVVARSSDPLLQYATISELLDWHVTGEVDRATLTARRAGYVAVLRDGGTVLMVGEAAATLAARARDSQDPVVASSRPVAVNGDCACPGRVTGRVRVVSFVSDDYESAVADFRPGEILVTGMTRPQIAHLCGLAAGIITDEGGITCHAAVIGRETGTPTLVATHDATTVLRTGDLVYLDARAGLVKILARHQGVQVADYSLAP